MESDLIDTLNIILQFLGGLGLFLLGMIVMTDGLKALAGNAIRRALMRFTRSPLSGAMTGATCTALLQSSSATTVAAVGFVGAGLMSFPSALGIIFGANLGTTITGWMVALLGFKLQLGLLVLPLILAGAIMHLFGRNRIANSGYAVAGFGLIFVGIMMLQQGMGGLHESLPFGQFSGDSLTDLIVLALLGIVFTVITQSSSAGVAAALTALFSGLIGFEQAAALVVGMDIGTTVTAALATIGRSVAARRTGFSHVIYNCLTGLGAFLLISPYVLLWETLAPNALMANAEIALVAFHTSFNLLGVIIVLPFTKQFARLVERLIPATAPQRTDILDHSLLQEPALAINAVQIAIEDVFHLLLRHIAVLLGSATPPPSSTAQPISLHEIQQTLDQIHNYLDEIHLEREQSAEWQRLVALIHTLDHMQRLHERCDEDAERAVTARTTATLQSQCAELVDGIGEIEIAAHSRRWHAACQRASLIATTINENRPEARATVMASIGSGELTVPDGTARLEAVRWLHRVSHHIARICTHITEAYVASAK